MKHQLEWSSVFGMIGSAVAFVTIVVVFSFMNFQTIAQAEKESQNVKEQQQEINADIHELRATIVEAQKQLNDKLDRLLQRPK